MLCRGELEVETTECGGYWAGLGFLLGLQLSKVCSEVGDGWGGAGFMIWVRSGMTWEPKAVLEFNLALGWDWARGTLFSDSSVSCLPSSGVAVTRGREKGFHSCCLFLPRSFAT